MQSYDVLMLVVLVGATLFGAWKGVAWQIASIASLTVSYFASLTFSSKLAPLISNDAPWNRFIAMLLIYILTSMAIWMVFRMVARAIDRVQLREFDRQIGALFGLAKGILICVAITMFSVTLLPAEQKEKILGSKSGLYIAKLLDKADQVMPDEIHDVLHPYIHKAQETLDPNYVPHGEEGGPRTATRPEEGTSNPAAPQFTLPDNASAEDVLNATLEQMRSRLSQPASPPGQTPFTLPNNASAEEALKAALDQMRNGLNKPASPPGQPPNTTLQPQIR